MEYKYYSDPCGICELTVTSSCKEHYSESDQLIAYEIIEKQYGGLKESLKLICQYYPFDLGLPGTLLERHRITIDCSSTKVYRGDNTLQAEYSEDHSVAETQEVRDDWSLIIYDKEGKNPVYRLGNACDPERLFTRSYYGTYIVYDHDAFTDSANDFIGTVSLGGLLNKLSDYCLQPVISFDSDNNLPWGTIEKVNITPDLFKEGRYEITLSDGFNNIKSLLKDGMTVADLSKLVPSGRCFNYISDATSNKPAGTILAIERNTEEDSVINLTVAGSAWNEIPNYKLASETEKDGVITRYYTDPYGVSDYTITETRKDNYSKNKKLESYEIIQTVNGGFYEDMCDVPYGYHSTAKSDWDICYVLSDYIAANRQTITKVYRADNTIQSKCIEDYHTWLERGVACEGFIGYWRVWTYDGNGENPVKTDGLIDFDGSYVGWEAMQ